MLVRAKRLGFYDNKRRKPGQERLEGAEVKEAPRVVKAQDKPAPKELI